MSAHRDMSHDELDVLLAVLLTELKLRGGRFRLPASVYHEVLSQIRHGSGGTVHIDSLPSYRSPMSGPVIDVTYERDRAERHDPDSSLRIRSLEEMQRDAIRAPKVGDVLFGEMGERDQDELPSFAWLRAAVDAVSPEDAQWLRSVGVKP